MGLTLAAAAISAAFVGGVVAGRSYGRRDPAPSVLAATDAVEAEVLAAGEEARAFPLPGGGRITLSPGATVEIDRAGAELTLKLVQGDATLETAQSEAAMVVGDARLNTQAGSTVNVSRRVDNLNVGVTHGTASLESPSMKEKLGSGDAVSVALHREVASTPSHSAIAAVRGARAPLRRGAEATPAEIAAAPLPVADGTESAASDKEAADCIQHATGGFDSAIRQAARASDLMRLYAFSRASQKTVPPRLKRSSAPPRRSRTTPTRASPPTTSASSSAKPAKARSTASAPSTARSSTRRPRRAASSGSCRPRVTRMKRSAWPGSI